MWAWLAGLPIFWQIGFPLVAIISIVIIAIFGHLALNWKQKKLSLGDSKLEPESEENKDHLVQIKYRTCSDCIRILMSIETKYRMKREDTISSVLRDQMNYAEQRMQELEITLTRSYRTEIVSKRKPDISPDYVLEQKEYLLYQESLSKAFVHVKDEVRRSFKENGFHKLTGTEFSDYIKHRSKILISIAKEYILSRYPFENMIIPIQARLDGLDETNIEDIVNDVFTNAKEIKKTSIEVLETLNQDFEKEINTFQNSNKESS